MYLEHHFRELFLHVFYNISASSELNKWKKCVREREREREGGWKNQKISKEKKERNIVTPVNDKMLRHLYKLSYVRVSLTRYFFASHFEIRLKWRKLNLLTSKRIQGHRVSVVCCFRFDVTNYTVQCVLEWVVVVKMLLYTAIFE